MRNISLLFLILLSSLSVLAQADMAQLQRWINGASRYDNEYPREQVYVHLDQQAYLHGETMWIKAYVMRASSLTPQPVSRVLFVELLNTEGNIMERQLLRIDALGQAEGHIDLVDPIKSGFYELRAYTREMLNWGTDALFSQVVPVFGDDGEAPVAPYDLRTAKSTLQNGSAQGNAVATTGALAVDKSEGNYIITAGAGVDSMQLCALLVTSRERPCYVDTLTIGGAAGEVQIEVDNTTLRDGWNRCMLLTTRGSSLGETWLWKKPVVDRDLAVTIRQNKGTYSPFEPIAIEVEVRDQQGRPVKGAQFSMAVHDGDGLLADVPHEGMLESLMNNRGGQSTELSIITGAKPFKLEHPIEEKLLLQGQVFKDDDRLTPRPNFNLYVSMYSPEGGALKGDARTDAEGRFAFTSNEDFMGEWIAQFSTLNDNGRAKWSRVALNRWFDIPKRQWTANDFIFTPITPLSANASALSPQLFQWEDTIPRMSKNIMLGEAKVTGKGKYGGLKGDRHSYQGGEKRGKYYTDKYINVVQALEQWKDQGGGNDQLQYFLQDYDTDFKYYPINYRTPYHTIPLKEQVEGLNFFYKGQPAYVFIDNKLVTIDHDLYRNEAGEQLNPDEVMTMRKEIGESMTILQSNYWASEIKSVVVMTERDHWWRFLNDKEQQYIRALPQHHTAIFIYTRPDHYRYRGKKGVDMRVIQGFQRPTPYPAPRYNIEEENPDDLRRTLYWAPTLTTDAQGKASCVFFNGARPDTNLAFSLRGITPQGYIINVDK